MNFDFKSMATYHYLMMGGGGLLILAILVYALTGRKGRVAAFAAAIIGSLAVGFGTGIVALGANGYHWDRKPDRFDPYPPGPAGTPKTPATKDNKKDDKAPMNKAPE
jgi:hypothetical protein